MDASDAELIARHVASPDASVREEIVRRYLGKVRRMVWPMVLDDSTADDLTQEVFLRVLKQLESFQGRSEFSTWIYRITMNTVYEHLRRAARRRPQLAPRASDLSEFADASASPEQLAVGSELGQQIDGAIEELSPKLRAAIVLVTLNQMAPGEAAEIEGCSAATINWRVHKARKQLKQRLKPYFET